MLDDWFGWLTVLGCPKSWSADDVQSAVRQIPVDVAQAMFGRRPQPQAAKLVELREVVQHSIRTLAGDAELELDFEIVLEPHA